jgi:hypothetical protein
MKTLATLLVLAATAACLADQTIYSTKWENGWESWSWAKVSFSGKTINVDASKAWQAAAFHHKPQTSAGVTAVQFRAFGGPKGGQRIQLRATVDKNKPLKEAFLPALPAGKWVTFTVTTKQLGLTGQAFDGFWIQAQQACTFQISDVTLKGK